MRSVNETFSDTFREKSIIQRDIIIAYIVREITFNGISYARDKRKAHIVNSVNNKSSGTNFYATF